MSVTFTFNEISEKMPVHDQSIIFLNRMYSFSLEGFEPKECLAKYDWVQINENGEETGTSAIYDPTEPDVQGLVPGDILNDCWKLVMTFNGYQVTKDTLWIDADEYWNEFN